MKDKKLLFGLSGVILLVLILAFYFIKQHHGECATCLKFKLFSPEVIKHYLLGFGPWAVVVFIILYALNTVSIVPPIGVMSLASGFVFGPLWGTVGLMGGAFLGTTATFFISRSLGARWVDQIIKGKAREFEEKINQNGFTAILLMRLIPLIPWEVINYTSGLTKITYRDFILGTMIGILPSVVIQTYFSDRLANFSWKDPQLFIAIGAFALLILVPVIYLSFAKKMQA